MASGLKIQVTQLDIDQGRPNDPLDCPVARALKCAIAVRENMPLGQLACGTPFSPTVYDSSVIVNGRVSPLPPAVEIWIAAFDCKGPDAVKPMSFFLELLA